ncbi:MAG: TonB-dependent receptor [Flavobacteriaceae bacterium]|nr:TonB-dependent receptor [Flavobacteriaceae bacterium]
MRKLTFLFCLFVVSASFAQYHSFEISGKIIDKATSTPLEEVTVYLEKPKDSSVITYSITDRKGHFTLEGRTTVKKARLYFSYIGYKTVKKVVNLTKKEIKFPNIIMEEQTNSLGEIVIKSTPPVRIKKDTLEFNVKSFKTKKDATVEDLLKKLPGVEVSKDGKIMVNGKPVTKLLVNGKEFFANDPTIATRNLTKDIIEKVQITDTKTKAQALTGEEGDKNSKTINLTIKKENNKGVFGRVAVGGGTDKLYEGAGMFNYFNDKQRFSVLAGGNNINSVGFSFGEIEKMVGSRGGMGLSMNNSGQVTQFSIGNISFGGGSGLVTSRNAGATYADEFGKNIEFNSDYFYSQMNSDDKNTIRRDYTLPDRKYSTDSESKSHSVNDNHVFSVNTDIEIDSTAQLGIKSNMNYNINKSESENTSSSYNPDQTLINNSKSNSVSDTDSKNIETNIDYGKRIGNKGASFRLSLHSEISDRKSDIHRKNEVEIAKNSAKNIFQRQKIDNRYYGQELGLKGSYNLPLFTIKDKKNGKIKKGQGIFLFLSYALRNRNNKDKNSTFDWNNRSGLYSDFNTKQSTDFQYLENTHRFVADLTYRMEKGRISFGVIPMFQSLENKDYLRPQLNIKRPFNFVNLSSSINQKIGKGYLYFRYNFEHKTPDLSQLQAYEDVSNPLNIVVGNPNLKLQKVHQTYLSYGAFNFQKQEGFHSNIGGMVVMNPIMVKSTIDENLARRTTYINGSKNIYSFWGSGGYNKKIAIDSIHSIKFGPRMYGNSSKVQNYSNNELYTANHTSVSPSFMVELSGSEWKLETTYSPSFKSLKYDISPLKGEHFWKQYVSTKARITFFKKLELNSDFSYEYFPKRQRSIAQSYWNWNASLSYEFNKKASLSLKAYDILNQNKDYRIRTTENYVEERTNLILQRYLMLTFSWKFNSLGKKGEVGDGGLYVF